MSKKSPNPIFSKYRNKIKNWTREWRTFKPEINYEKCTNCGVCAMYCPDGLIKVYQENDKKLL
jgi:Pyruvate/2-oxoacid:ferredoxin oxidoreductase delta subunit